jgi:hypothetical protein
MPSSLVLCGQLVRLAPDVLLVADQVSGVEARLEDVPEVLDCVQVALSSFAKPAVQETIIAAATPFDAQVAEAIAGLRRAGLLISPITASRRLLGRITTPVPPAAYSESVVYSASRWRPSEPLNVIAQGAQQPDASRAPSLPLDLDQHRGSYLSPGEIAEALALAYGTTASGRKPIASAGALWPLVLHAWLPTPSKRANLHWFDDQDLRLYSTATNYDFESLGACYLQDSYITAALERQAILLNISADVSRSAQKYGDRSVLFCVIEAGALMQRISDSAASMRMSVRPLGGFYPQKLALALGEVDPLLTVLILRIADGP